MRKKEKLRRQFHVALAIGVSGLGGAGVVLLGPAGGIVLGGLLLLGLLALAWAVVFSPRSEPFDRLLELVKALWRDR